MSTTSIVNNNFNSIDSEENKTANSNAKETYFQYMTSGEEEKVYITFAEMMPKENNNFVYKRKKDSPRTFTCGLNRVHGDSNKKIVREIKMFGNLLIHQNRSIVLFSGNLPNISEIQVYTKLKDKYIISDLGFKQKECSVKVFIKIPHEMLNTKHHYHLIYKSGNVLYKSPKLYMHSKASSFREKIKLPPVVIHHRSKRDKQEITHIAKGGRSKLQFSASSRTFFNENISPLTTVNFPLACNIINPSSFSASFALNSLPSSEKQSTPLTSASNTQNRPVDPNSYGILCRSFLGNFPGSSNPSSLHHKRKREDTEEPINEIKKPATQSGKKSDIHSLLN